MFETMIHASSPDSQRSQRLILAAGIAVATTTAAFATLWTLDKLGIDRIGGPNATLEILQFSLVTPPPPPPPPQLDDAQQQGAQGQVQAAAPAREVLEEPTDHVLATRSSTPGEIPDGGLDNGTGVPGIPQGSGCPAGVCGTGPIGSPTGTCVGPTCTLPSRPVVTLPPADVEFSALRCLACGDPDQDRLRKTVSSMHRRQGSVTVEFCVDTRGHVDDGSLKVSRSFGDSAVDNIVREAVAGWRFAPMQVAGKTRRACSSRRFNIKFD